MSTMQNNRRVYILLNAVSLVFLLSAIASAQDVWPQFRGPESNPVGTHAKLAERWSKTENVEWFQEIPGRGWSSPIVTGGKVYITTVTTEGKSKSPQTGTEYSNEYAAELQKQGLSMEEIMKRAQADLAATQKAIYETALPFYKKYFPNAAKSALDDKKKVTAAVLEKLAEQHPDDNTIVSYAQKIVREATDFTKQHDLVTVPDKPLDVIVMPEFKRGQGIAYCDSPGPLERNGKTFFAVEPTPKDWSAQRKESFFKEYNNYMCRDLTVHEAMPGHYLQLAHSNEFRAPTLVRAIFQSGTFIEGWAVYCEQMMAEQSYGGPEVKMQQLKMRLRVICNAILDQGIHGKNMSEKEAMELMMKEGFQQEGEAVAKWKRARLSSAQLSTYFVGVTEHLDLRDRAKARDGGAFNLKKYNDTVLSFGSPPVKYVRELMGL